MTHRLIITGDDEDPWYIEHDHDCPTMDLYGGGYCFDYVCSLGRELSNVGLDPELAALAPDTYEIEYWEESRAVDRYGTLEVVAAGIRLVFRDEVQTVVAGLDPERWKKITLQGRKTGFPWSETTPRQVDEAGRILRLPDKDA